MNKRINERAPIRSAGREENGCDGGGGRGGGEGKRKPARKKTAGRKNPPDFRSAFKTTAVSIETAAAAAADIAQRARARTVRRVIRMCG